MAIFYILTNKLLHYSVLVCIASNFRPLRNAAFSKSKDSHSCGYGAKAEKLAFPEHATSRFTNGMHMHFNKSNLGDILQVHEKETNPKTCLQIEQTLAIVFSRNTCKRPPVGTSQCSMH